jgi:hypothetical protein
MTDYEQLGVFYLGQEYDLASGQRKPDLVLYDSKDLTTHAVIVGMTGSGKTGLGIGILEEAAIDSIPSIVVDPKGDLSNLLLTFPQLKPEDFQPWIDPADAARKGMDVAGLAAKTAETWRKGLGEWNESPERIQKFRDAVDIAIYTPGSDAGLPISILRSLGAPSPEILDSGDAMRERVTGTVSGLLALVGIDADPIRSREHILLSTIVDAAWRDGTDLSLDDLVRQILSPPFKKVGAMDLEAIYPASDRQQLAMTINNVLASPGFAGWMRGEPLSIKNLLYTAEGKPRMSILSIAHLSDNERMFFLTILLNELIAWMRSQSGTSSLRALFYMDEMFGYLPPTANPPSKTPLLTLLKQARAFGVGMVLATQNPVDLDYKALSNAGTWFLGRLQTERDKARLLDGLDGVAIASDPKFDRSEIERQLSGLGHRVFLMNNINEDRHVVFETRQTLSYLSGPVTRDQIGKLMAGRKSAASASSSPSTRTVAAGAASTGAIGSSAPPILPADISPLYVSAKKATGPISYRPAILATTNCHFVDSKAGVDTWQKTVRISVVGDDVPADVWSESDEVAANQLAVSSQPASGAKFAELPVELTRAKSFTAWGKALKDYIYQNVLLDLKSAPSVSAISKAGESEADFRNRLTQAAREQRDAGVEKLRTKYASKIATLQDRIRRAEQKVQAEAEQAKNAKMSAVVSFGSTILSSFFGRKTVSMGNISKAATSVRAAGRAMQQGSDVGRAEETVQGLNDQLTDLQAQLTSETDALKASCDPASLAIESYSVKPRKSDIAVEQVTLAWLPFGADGQPAW